MAVMIYQPNPETVNFEPLPFFHLAQLHGRYYLDAAHCEFCRAGIPAEKVVI